MLSTNRDTNKNLTDTVKDIHAGLPNLSVTKGERERGGPSYTKTNKLVTALYMVTDIIDREEPIRNKLRTLGIEIISDIHNPNVARIVLAAKVDEVMSFLNIASAMTFISEMNCGILNKEFIELKRSLSGDLETKPNWLEEFLGDSPLEGWPMAGVEKFMPPHPNPLLKRRGGSYPPPPKGYSSRGESISKGHTNLGVQKASTLLKAIKEVSDRMPTSRTQEFDILKKQRRDEITNFIRKNGGSSTITDIKNGAEGSFASVSEKTLQRELMSMTKDGVLNKTGEKRWSRYFVK